jgi:hypothetical protein
VNTGFHKRKAFLSRLSNTFSRKTYGVNDSKTIVTSNCCGILFSLTIEPCNTKGKCLAKAIKNKNSNGNMNSNICSNFTLILPSENVCSMYYS